MKLTALLQAIKIMGSQEILASELGITQQTVSWWINHTKKIPAEYVLPIERAVRRKITRYQLRPDLYPIDE